LSGIYIGVILAFSPPPTIGRYKVLGVVGKIDDIVVLSCEDKLTGQLREMKAVRSRLSPPTSALYVDSPHIVKVIDLGSEVGWAHTVTEKVRWQPLSLMKAEKQSLTFYTLLLEGLLRAVKALYGAGIRYGYVDWRVIYWSPVGPVLDCIGISALVCDQTYCEGIYELLADSKKMFDVRWYKRALNLARREEIDKALKVLIDGYSSDARRRLAVLITQLAQAGKAAEPLRREILRVALMKRLDLAVVYDLEKRAEELLGAEVEESE